MEAAFQLYLGLDLAAGADRHLGRDHLEAIDGAEIESLRCTTKVDAANRLGSVRVTGVARCGAGCAVEVTVEGSAGVVRADSWTINHDPFDVSIERLPVDLATEWPRRPTALHGALSPDGAGWLHPGRTNASHRLQARRVAPL